MAARQSLDLAAQACALVSHAAPERPFRRHPVLLSAHRSVGLEAIRERPRIADLTLESWVGNLQGLLVRLHLSQRGYSIADMNLLEEHRRNGKKTIHSYLLHQAENGRGCV
jgi:hypothetical protein